MLSASSDQSAWGSGEHHRWTLGQLEGTPSNSQTQPRRRGAHRWGPGEPLAWQVWVGGRCVNTQAQWPPQEPAPAAQVPPGPGSCPSPRQPSRPRPWAPGSPRTCRHGVPPPAVRERAPDGKNAAAAISPAIPRRIPGPRAHGRGAAQHSALSPGVTQGHGKRRGDSGTRRPGGFPERMEQNRCAQNSRASLTSASANLFQSLAYQHRINKNRQALAPRQSR